MQLPRRHDFDPDDLPDPVLTLAAEVGPDVDEVPWHRHRKGQLIMALSGSVLCHTRTGLWTVPPRSAVWIPGGVWHSNRASGEARMVYVFIAPERAPMPARCCTLLLTPLVQELVVRLDQGCADAAHRAQLEQLLLTELGLLAPQDYHVPLPEEPRLRRMAEAMLEGPAVRRSLKQWAYALAMSERTLQRLISAHTGTSFTPWQRQLRIMRAVQLLASGDSVKQVAAELGYESVSAFVYRFRRVTGVSPGQFLDRR
ncbi:AraC family transcriptional regulator [Isoalcanivorax beigongshangi]|uniref:Helix-turn-helix transcriptional regulator n=1 Tax=Isoalcanivorax beigongshangi TaxID=3238810 RepID=A0ABV4ADT8_9GAMM